VEGWGGKGEGGVRMERRLGGEKGVEDANFYIRGRKRDDWGGRVR